MTQTSVGKIVADRSSGNSPDSSEKQTAIVKVSVVGDRGVR
ncbi:hypothetical protein CKA32_004289 [Geitlerinema sp. FC II]|nr:hypothetical protein CKA32_004289 [Geitlerinema sp. FC II]